MAAPNRIIFRKVPKGGDSAEVPSSVCHVLIFLNIIVEETYPKSWNDLQFYDQKALFKVPKICNTPLWHFSKNASDLVAGPFPHSETPWSFLIFFLVPNMFVFALEVLTSMWCRRWFSANPLLLSLNPRNGHFKWHSYWDARLAPAPAKMAAPAPKIFNSAPPRPGKRFFFSARSQSQFIQELNIRVYP